MAAEAWFGSPLLSRLDGRGRADVTSAGSVHRFVSGARVFQSGDAGDTLWFVGSGAIALASARGVRRLGPREHFGTEAFVPGALRVTSATAERESSLLELPVAVLRRVLARTGAEGPLVRVEAAARRQAFALLVAESPLGRACDAATLAAFASELCEERRAAGEALWLAGERARAAYFVVSGLIGLRAGGAELHAARGDWLAIDAALAGALHAEAATALGDALVLLASSDALRALVARCPAALDEQRSVTDARRAKQRRVHALVGVSTASALPELARLESARSLLVIDAERCVRCGHCVEACASAHGTPRLERRGARVRLTLVGRDFDGRAHALVLARSCQHCREPACLAECPTGAIVRSGDGTVLVREEACTGCGACAKACPWDAVRMAPRAAAAGTSALVAHKCDLCHGRDGPECVAACPTGAVARLDPSREVLELTGVRAEHQRRDAPTSAGTTQMSALVRSVLALSVLPPLVAWLRFGAGIPRATVVSGAVAAFSCCVVGLYPVAKRVRPLRARLAGTANRLAAGRGFAPWRWLHELLGAFAGALVLAHAGTRLPAGVAGALALAFWLLAASGAALAVVYRSLPRRLARLERHGGLPEDRVAEFAELEQRLFRALTGGERAQKELVRRLLAPYAFGAGGALALVVSARTLGEERAALGARLERVLGGRTSERLGDTSELVETAVALRALRARALLEGVLALSLPLHVALALFFVVLLVLHVVAVLG